MKTIKSVALRLGRRACEPFRSSISATETFGRDPPPETLGGGGHHISRGKIPKRYHHGCRRRRSSYFCCTEIHLWRILATFSAVTLLMSPGRGERLSEDSLSRHGVCFTFSGTTDGRVAPRTTHKTTRHEMRFSRRLDNSLEPRIDWNRINPSCPVANHVLRISKAERTLLLHSRWQELLKTKHSQIKMSYLYKQHDNGGRNVEILTTPTHQIVRTYSPSGTYNSARTAIVPAFLKNGSEPTT